MASELPETSSLSSSSLYQPLPDNSFRLLKFFSTDASGNPIYDLSVHDLNSPPPYYALSYVWMTSKAEKSIICNGQKVGITENLYQALQRLNREICSTDLIDGNPPTKILVSSVCFWVDQLCIDQSNIDEKVQQIERMREIFSLAIRTIIWYGSNASASIAESMRIFGRIYASGWGTKTESFDLSMVKLPDIESPFWLEFSTFLSAPWTTRIWVVQEAAVSRIDPIIVCGERAFGFHGFCYTAVTINWMTETDDHMKAALGRLHRAEFFGVLGDLHDCFAAAGKGPRRVYLGDLLYMLPLMNASDERDLIYAVLGLTHFADGSSHGGVSIVPDYDRDAYELFRFVAKYAIRSTGSLRILFNAGVDRVRNEAESGRCCLEHPSWTPLFYYSHASSSTSIVATNACHLDSDGTVYSRSEMSIDASGGKPALLREDCSEDKLILKGLRLGTVMLTVPQIRLENGRLNEPKTFISQWEAALKHFGIRGDVPSDSLSSFAAKFFAVTHPFAWDSAGMQIIRKNTEMSLKSCWSDLNLAYERLGGPRVFNPQVSPDEEIPDEERHRGTSVNYTFFITHDGYMGCGPSSMRPNDQIYILYGGRFPYILEKCGDEYHFLGDAFIREYMNDDSAPQDDHLKGEQMEEWVTIH